MNKELLKLIGKPLAQPSIVLPLPCHVTYMSLCWRGFRKRTQFRWHESEMNSDLIFHSHILCSEAVLGKYTLCYKYFRTVCPHWHFHFLKWNPHWPTERKKAGFVNQLYFNKHPYGKNFLWWVTHSCQTPTFLCLTCAEIRSVEANCRSLNHLIVCVFSYLDLHLSQIQCVLHENSILQISQKKKSHSNGSVLSR